ncbi:helix-turn-helix domain-containing protein [Nocardioides cynanchi]|uniref:helix-turn-helix domain-containing protein n=1 Tax=Nocardioides cynanchi TaxID=2558918 RepID=UPI001247B2C9|nr:helix-turn-helix domain-containing protein [Nocardioides cynanchi]
MNGNLLLLTLEMAGDQLGVSAKTVRRLIAAGHLRGTFVGRQVRVRPEDLAEFLASAAAPQSLGSRR